MSRAPPSQPQEEPESFVATGKAWEQRSFVADTHETDAAFCFLGSRPNDRKPLQNRGTITVRIEHYVVLGIAAIPFIYYLLAVYSTLRYFARARRPRTKQPDFTPPVSCLKAIRGLDEEAYENYASFCRQDYPEYEIVFCVDENDPALPILKKLMQDYPGTNIRLLFGPDHTAINDKVARLDRLSKEARYEVLVLTDGDVRVVPDYLRSVVAPLQNPRIGGVTCFYAAAKETTFIEKLQELGMMCDFFPGILVAWQLDGVKFGF